MSEPAIEGEVMEHNAQIVRAPITAEIRPLRVDDAVARLAAVRQYVQSQLIEGQDYGTVPGVSKPFLWKSGAEKLLLLHQCAPRFVQIEDHSERDGKYPYWEYTYRCEVLHVPTGQVIASGDGTCSSRERKYAQDDGTPKGDPWMQANTVRKMAQKRALVAASLHIGALSDVFTQDEEAVEERPPQAAPRPASAPVQQRSNGGGDLCVPRWKTFGRDGGVPLARASTATLDSVIDAMSKPKAVNDPKWGAKNVALRDAARAEVEARIRQSEGAPADDAPPPHTDDDLPF